MSTLKYGGVMAAWLLASIAGASTVAHWSFDEGVGQEINDACGAGAPAALGPHTWMQGVHNVCARLERSPGINAGHSAEWDLERELTIEAWVNPYKLDYRLQPSLLKKDGAYALGFSSNKALMLTLWLNGKPQTFESDHTAWSKGRWAHVAATFDGMNVCLYVNGGLDKMLPVTAGSIISKSKSDLIIAPSYAGALDELKLTDDALSSREIAQATLAGKFQIARREDRFTDFYEKNMKRKAMAVVPGTLWVDAEDFETYGGWWMDTQFVPQMGSPYLMAAGVGTPVANAATTIDVPESGEYKLWVRNKNWIAQGHAPGTFSVIVGGAKSEATFGTGEQRAWIWQDGGTFTLPQGATRIELEDLTGYYGRCDALILTKDLNWVPRQEQLDYKAERSRFVETVPAKDMGHYDVVVVGAGVAGCNAAIAAARGGATVALIQDRPMLGGNNSAELGVPVFGGSSSSRGRETGLNEEVGRVSSFNYLNKWASGADLVVASEPNISLFLNSHVYAAETDRENKIKSVMAFNMIDDHRTRYTGDIFIDSTGDGWLGYYAGAEWMLGRESKAQFGEEHGKPVADSVTMSGSLMQNSILGYQAIDTGKPVQMKAPEWVYDLRANADGYTEHRPNYDKGVQGGNWWTENHGRNDDLWDPEWARDDLIMVSLSYYNWIKNYSPMAEKAKNFKLRFIPVTNAKRETRRLIGDHVLVEQEVVARKVFSDRVGYFVWGLDVHNPLGIFSKESPFDYHVRFSPASMPFRILYSKNIPNMLMAGRNVSVSHATLGTARVQGTTGMMGQVVGTAAAMCVKEHTLPRGIYEGHMEELQQQLIKDDMTILHLRNEDPNDLALSSRVTASSSRSIHGPENVINGLTRSLDDNMEMWCENEQVPFNMWISDPNQPMPQWLELDFGHARSVNAVYLTFDTKLKTKRYITWEQKDEERMPLECVRDYQVQVKTANGWETVADVKHNWQRRRIHRFPKVKASKIRVLITATNGDQSARMYEIRAYNE